MDPNATLEELRYVIGDFEQWQQDHYKNPQIHGKASDFMEDMIHHFANLDSWLKSGGFLPADWTVAPND